MKKGIITILLAALCTVLFYGIRYVKSPVETMKAEKITYEEAVHSKAYFIRDETLYKADSTGTVYNHYSDGTRVKKDSLIATVYQGTVGEDTLQELGTIDKKLATAQNIQENTTIASSDNASLESRVESYKNDIIQAGENNKVQKAGEYKARINSLRTGEEVKTTEDTIQELQGQKLGVEQRIGGSKREVFAEISGIFTTVLDGLEETLTPEAAKQLTVSDFNAIRPVQAKSANQVVNAGDYICKVVNNHQWYVMMLVDKTKLADYREGSTVKMRFDSIPGEEANGKILYISPEEDGKVLVLAQSQHYLEGAFSFRESEAQMIFKSYTGYKVPIHAIRTEDGKRGVLAEAKNVQKFYPCEVLYTNNEEGFVVVNSVKDAQNKLEDADKIIIGER